MFEIDGSVPAQLLDALGVDVNQIRDDIEQVLKTRPR